MPNYDNFAGSSSSTDYNESIEMLTTPYATIEADLTRVFGTSSQYGESLGVNFSDPELVDGVVGYDAEKDKLKIFSWREAVGLSPEESLDRGNEPDATDVDDVITKTYVGNRKTYEVIAARMPEVEDDDGNVVVEASSRERSVTVEEDGALEFTPWESLDGEKPELEQDAVMWFDGSDEYGPSASSKRMARLTTSLGDEMIADEDDVHNWLGDTSGENVLRDDLQDRRVQYFKVERESENGNTYHVPILLDAETGAEVTVNNRGGSGNEQQPDGDADGSGPASESSGSFDSGESPDPYPEPVANYINSVDRIDGMDEESAGELLDELIADSDNPMTEEYVEEAGGREQVLSEAV